MKTRAVVLMFVVWVTAGCAAPTHPPGPTMTRSTRRDQNTQLLTPTPTVIRTDVPNVAPSPHVTVDWTATSGGATTNAPGGSDPTASLTVVNEASPAVVFDYDVYVLSSDPSSAPGRALPSAYSSRPGSLWDWRQSSAGRAAPPGWAIVSGSTSDFSVSWPRTRQDGRALPGGTYLLVVTITFNGLPAGSAEAAYALS